VKVAVVGAGGIGSVFGGRLATAGHNVWLIHRRAELVEAIRRDGLRLSTRSGDEHIPLAATLDPAEVGPVDLVLIATKSNDTASAADAALPLVDSATVVLTLQNGLGNLETIAHALGAEHCLLGMTYLGASMRGPGHVAFTAPGATFIGEANGRLSDRVLALAETLSAAGVPTEATDQLWGMVWGKLIINAALNATCALTGAGGTDVLGSDAARQLIGLVAEETARVAAALGIQLPYPDARERVLQHCRDIRDAKPSMLQDFERGRPTEIDAINGAIVREGRRLGVATPYNEALLLVVKAREQVVARAG
jgi:2-dehydropantoate 2-reductase